ncbi:1363_t:CDS:2 [Diversispora eburnea]|uniref:1363_t:CDS:1 n=1 Tax=Diversispora eburnea TaxID=1213867 RepID=A0A9N8YMP5_9GLOM|nr:1363_t:CDS:2 [Diversispora eburnea]
MYSFISYPSSTVSTVPTSHISFNSTVSTVATSHMQSPLRLKDRLNQARDRLLAYQEKKIEMSEDIIIAENVSLEAYIKYLEAERKLPVRIRLVDGRINGTRAMLALRYLRTNRNNTIPDIIISFGTAPLRNNTIEFLTNIVGVPPANITGFGFGFGFEFSATSCNFDGIPDYQLHIPAIELFNGAFGCVPTSAVNGFLLDLWELQDLILSDF